MASDESAYIFGRDSDEEKVVVAFNNSNAARNISIPLQDTSAKNAAALTPLFGDAQAKISAGDHLEITMPPQSLSIFLLD
jgi:O-glycosyl hydrolase